MSIHESLLQLAKDDGPYHARDLAEEWYEALEAMAEVASEVERAATLILQKSLEDTLEHLHNLCCDEDERRTAR